MSLPPFLFLVLKTCEKGTYEKGTYEKGLICSVPNFFVASLGKVRLDADEGAFSGLFLFRFLIFPLLPGLTVSAAVPKELRTRMGMMPLIPEYW